MKEHASPTSENKPLELEGSGLEPNVLQLSATTGGADAGLNGGGNTQPFQVQGEENSEGNSDPEALKKLIQACESGNYLVMQVYFPKVDARDLAALGLEQRIKLIKGVTGGFFDNTSRPYEEFIVRIFNSAPAQQHAGLFDWMSANKGKWYKRLQSAINWEPFAELHRRFRQMAGNQLDMRQAAGEMEQMQEQGSEHKRVVPWADPGMFSSIWKHNVSVQAKWTAEGQVQVSYIHWETGQIDAFETAPHEMIGIHFLEDEEELNASKGQMLFVPAINLFQLTARAKDRKVRTLVDLGLLVVGVGELKAAIKAAKFGIRGVMAVADIFFATGDLVLADLRHDIAKSPGGQDFLNAWDKLTGLFALFGVAQVLNAGRQYLRQTRKAAQKLQAGSSGDIRDFARQTDEALAEVDEALEQQLKSKVDGGLEAAIPERGLGQALAQDDLSPPTKRRNRKLNPKYEAYSSMRMDQAAFHIKSIVYDNDTRKVIDELMAMRAKAKANPGSFPVPVSRMSEAIGEFAGEYAVATRIPELYRAQGIEVNNLNKLWPAGSVVAEAKTKSPEDFFKEFQYGGNREFDQVWEARLTGPDGKPHTEMLVPENKGGYSKNSNEGKGAKVEYTDNDGYLKNGQTEQGSRGYLEGTIAKMLEKAEEGEDLAMYQAAKALSKTYRKSGTENIRYFVVNQTITQADGVGKTSLNELDVSKNFQTGDF